MRKFNFSTQIQYGLIFWIVLLLTVFLYAEGLQGPLLLDDRTNLEPLQQLDLELPWWEVVRLNESGIFGRIISMTTFVVDYKISDGSIRHYKITNLVIHLLIGCISFLWLSIILKTRMKVEHHYLIALFITSCWLLNPFNVSTVLYTVQRMTQLSAFFMMLGCLLYTIGRNQISASNNWGWILIVFSLIFCTLFAALSKENGVLLLLILFIMEYFVFRELPKVSRISFDLKITSLTIFIVIMFYWTSQQDVFMSGYEHRNFDVINRLLTESRILIVYLKNIFLPVSSSFGVFHDDIEVSKNLLSPITTLLSMFFWLLVITIICLNLNKNIFRYFRFCMAWFLCGHLLESTIFPLELYFEHRNYFPSIGVLLFLGLVINWFQYKTHIVRILLILPILYGLQTYQMSITWSSIESFSKNAYVTHPNSPRAKLQLSEMYRAEGDLKKSYSIVKELHDFPDYRFGATLHEISLACMAGMQYPEKYIQSLATIQPIKPIQTNYESTSIKVLAVVMTKACPSWPVNDLAKVVFDWASLNLKTGTESRQKTAVIIATEFLHNNDSIELALILLEIYNNQNHNFIPTHLRYVEYALKSNRLDLAKNEIDLLERKTGVMNAIERKYFNQYRRIVYSTL